MLKHSRHVPCRALSWLVGFSLVLLAACGGSTSTNKNPTPSAPVTPIQFAVESATLQVPEGEAVALRVKLSSAPTSQVTAILRRLSGDVDIVPGATSSATFDSKTWDQFQTLEIRAVADADAVNGTATLRLSASGVAALDIAATEIDSSSTAQAIAVVTDVATVEMAENASAAVRVKLRSAPAQVTTVDVQKVTGLADLSMGGVDRLSFTPQNWDQYQTLNLTAAADADPCNDNGELQLSVVGYASATVQVTIRDAQRPVSSDALICGTITVPVNTAADSDVNDEQAPFESNDTFAVAQAIPNPVSVAGYVNAAQTGADGRSFRAGDLSDFYVADFASGQTISLYVGQPQQAEVDLYLWDDAQQVKDVAIGADAVKTLRVPASGRYFIEVRICTGPNCTVVGGSNYVLVLGQSIAAVSNGLRLSDAFVPGQVVAQWQEMATARQLVSPMAAVLPGWSQVAGAPSRGALLTAPTATLGGARSLSVVAPEPGLSAEQQAKLDTLRAVSLLRSRADITSAEPNYLYQTFAVPNDPLYRLQWHYGLINLPQAWDLSAGAASVAVAVIDTGVLLNHPDLKGQLVAGYDFISNIDNSLDGDGIDANPDDPGDQSPGGSTFHGTHVSGTIAAASNNSVGVAGVAWGARVMPLRALGFLGGTSYDIQQALRYAAGLPNDSRTVPPKRADVINLSFGDKAFSASMASLVKQIYDMGIVVVAAAGNSTTSAPMYPAAFDGVISVTAVDSGQQRATYANFGPTIDVAAPGGDTSQDRNGDGVSDGVVSTGGSDTSGSIQFRYPIFQGTSMAAPHVSGVVALMKSVYPVLTSQLVDSLLAAGKLTRDLGAVGRDDQFGYGLIDAMRAVSEAAALAGGGSSAPPPQLSIQPAALSFGSTATSLTISITNSGSGQFTVQSVTANQAWLKILTNAGQKAGEYSAVVDRAGLANGTYQAKVTVVSSAGTMEVPVIMQVSSLGLAQDAGVHYVELFDPASHAVLAVQMVSAKNGKYQFVLSDVAPGTYHLFAGSDFNQDGFLCDAGEACGAFGTRSQPTMLTVTNADINDADFSTSFVIDAAAVQATKGVATTLALPRAPLQ